MFVLKIHLLKAFSTTKEILQKASDLQVLNLKKCQKTYFLFFNKILLERPEHFLIQNSNSEDFQHNIVATQAHAKIMPWTRTSGSGTGNLRTWSWGPLSKGKSGIRDPPYSVKVDKKGVCNDISRWLHRMVTREKLLTLLRKLPRMFCKADVVGYIFIKAQRSSPFNAVKVR